MVAAVENLGDALGGDDGHHPAAVADPVDRGLELAPLLAPEEKNQSDQQSRSHSD